MSVAASQADAFYHEVAKHQRLWTVKDDIGYPAPLTASGRRAQPFWSSLSRVEKIIQTAPAYSAFVPVEITWTEFREKWLPDLSSDGLLIGVNWSGPKATGYDLDPSVVEKSILVRLGEERGIG